MLFNSLAFLVFFPVFLTAYFLARGRVRLGICLAASYVFYGWWDWRFLALLMFDTMWDYNIGLLLARVRGPRARRWLIIASVSENLGLLGVFKYFDFFVDSMIHVSSLLGLGLSAPALRIILPIGISFYTFQSMSYTLDVYWKKLDTEPDFLRFAAFIALFPQLVAGPIVRAKHLLPQMRRDQPFSAANLTSGLHLMLWGYFKKVVVADSLAPLVDARFANPAAHGTLSMSIGLLFYAFQIYCDFSGYSDIAIGAGRMMGFDFGINFNTPYFSRGFREFWRRWHISLSTWLRDYLYIPLGGNRHGAARTYRNVMLTMLLGGLWHGANWTFVIWGGLHGIYLVVERFVGPQYRRVCAWLRAPEFVRHAVAMLAVFSLTCLAWVFFRSPDLPTALEVLHLTFGLGALHQTAVPLAFDVVKGALVIAILVAADALGSAARVRALIERSPQWSLTTSAACLWAIALLGTFSGTRFIYFQF